MEEGSNEVEDLDVGSVISALIQGLRVGFTVGIKKTESISFISGSFGNLILQSHSQTEVSKNFVNP